MLEFYSNKGRRISKLLFASSLPLMLMQAPSVYSKSSNVMEIAVESRQNEKTISGSVKDSNGEPLPGVNVIVKGTSNGTITDFDGNFRVDLSSEDAILVFSFVGYKSQEIIIGSKSIVNVVLESDYTQLNEIVVVGYGVQKKSDVTSSVVSVDAEEMKKVSVPNAASMLQGRASGVIVTTSGEPGAAPNVTIRGMSSLGGGSPLYVVDGVPTNSYYLDPSNIESMEILKDAAAASIYGTRAASGVILITTKRGAKNQGMKVDFDASFGIQNPTNLQEMANSSEYLAFDKVLHENAGQTTDLDLEGQDIPDTDWQKEIQNKNAFQQKYNLGLHGGGENSSYNLSVGYFDQEGMIKGTGIQRYSFRLNTDFEKGKFRFSPNVSYTKQKDQYETTSFTDAQRMLPIVPVYDESKSSGYGYGYLDGRNPVGDIDLKTSDGETDYANINLKVDYQVIEDLKFTVRGGMEKTDYFGYYRHAPHQISLQQGTDDAVHKLEDNNSKRLNLVGEAFATYNKSLDKHRFSLMAGTSTEDRWYRNSYVTIVGRDQDGNSAGFPNENGSTIDAGQGGTYKAEGYEERIRYVSFFSRINYAFDDKYMVQASLRQDASSKFGSKNRWGTFPSVSLGWNLHKESFLENVELISQLKLRGGYGVLGNDRSLGAYSKTARFYSGGYQTAYPIGVDERIVTPVYSKDLQNDELRWEQTIDMNIGFDFGLFNDKLTGSIEYFDKETEDILMRTLVSPSSGKDDPYTNLGSMKNSGFDMSLTYRDRINDFSYSVTGTLSTLKNEITKLNSADEKIYGYDIAYRGSVTRTSVGEPISAFYLLQADGIFQNMDEIYAHTSTVNGEAVIVQPNAKPGDVRYKDINGDGVLNDEDNMYSGKYLPDLTYSFNVNLGYKNFDLSMFFQGVAGNQIYNVQKLYTEGVGMTTRQAVSQEAATNYWSESNTNTNIPRPALNAVDNARHSTRFLEDGDYLRLKNIQIGYVLPKAILEKINIERLRVFVSADNLFTITKYTGMDPEINSRITNTSTDRLNAYTLGVGYPGYPMGKTFLMGVQLNF
ncbi:SusC/RagA family TonB-linked outer membrane protein [Aureibacter tunicatorum]|uniref:TonB-linked SusC/RagA family outer membrane protein n=1 Tax=Aureibacter tunicatorum TaxID=866807 RepID=A0AAE4BRS5_9BACT|nr:TonB-dependent receptor [Aureibacter tunicatorum]MDR6237537.1 TonB-linked SusC/RagA family outer membrane protein [Aureibacter tunicatorum]BDD02571.1 SusC/RagA family TonB-linked outer membrane protein [Aureibacter tunicatorum]